MDLLISMLLFNCALNCVAVVIYFAWCVFPGFSLMSVVILNSTGRWSEVTSLGVVGFIISMFFESIMCKIFVRRLLASYLLDFPEHEY